MDWGGGEMVTKVFSFGGGVQSTAVACLIANGTLEKPDLAVIADTGREASTTWEYLRVAVQPLLDRIGVKVEIASHSLSKVDLYSKSGKLLIPAFQKGASSAVGQLPNYCSVEWKRRVVRRWLRQRGVKKAQVWLGISLDEVGRAKPSDVGWIEHRFPLLDLRMRRGDCHRIIKEALLPEAKKSSCWMCPYRGPKEWRMLTFEDQDKARAFDAEIRKDGFHLRRDLKPYDASGLTEQKENDLFGEVTGCDSGYCWT